MGAAILDGSAIAAAVRAELAEEVASLAQVGVTPGLGTILVGDNPASASYVRLKHQDCEEIGIRSFGEHLAEDSSEERLHEVIASFNANPDIDAFLVQLPLPKGLDELQALLAVNPVKDVDGLPPVTLGRLVMGTLGPIPCTPAG
ncbi:MAG: bifunctional methylenetetrahydrofolate dehydrogenase/methenyltetrahydrofolate cyclohydrolase, partial [Acidimicrobiia bacterium]|nr:bifunctional methylenetetrahydrofolate dehydrogenase/methenyltetrahydrofolate cyclohydrolase [Acidimicrobiia bacterium]